MRPWLRQYQLPDGGLNCDEAACVKSLKSSMVSTLPPLEAASRRCYRLVYTGAVGRGATARRG
jgi:hypothetical protein